MALVFYPAIIAREPEGGFSVSFPDVPGCFSEGDTINEAAVSAEEALRGHLAAMADQGMKVDAPSAIDAIEAEPGAAIVLIPAAPPSRSVRIQVSIEEGLLDRIDRVAPNRSRFLAEAAREKLAAA